MYTSKSTTVFCRCGECGSDIKKSGISIFSLSGEEMRVKCDNCEGSALSLALFHTDSVRLEVPCVFCRSTHKFNLSAQTFFDIDAISLRCAMTGFDVCIIGTDDAKVEESIEKADAELESLIAQTGAGDVEDMDITNTDGIEEILKVVNKYIADGKIYCDCKPKTNLANLSLTVFGACAEIKCKKCEASIYIDSLIADEYIRIFEEENGILLE